ncbi:HTTM domain-containing protein [Aureicoccus marinus]|uniref:HTTM-like domain-containing protein n=1 Tax=Aureicoccus marinus TaxID=754435 RepID=A0A2S7T7W1_9FLAO|nr:HTTM domain-containing protein [Aureicoccus marinus]PQJ16010.1 hypothetical protein BST99_10000 [Aureicoccus marinus]
MKRWLFERTDNITLVLFRIFYGFLMAAESFGALSTGWVRRTLIEPQFTFNFIGFDWLQPLPGWGMYAYFALMGIAGLCIMVGYRYRLATFSFAILWTGVYLMQKTSYNNHYYLMVLLGFIMAFLPANRDLSVDAHRNPALRRQDMSRGILVLIIAQLAIVYTYASVAKLYADWLDFSFLKLLMESKKDLPVIGEFLQQEWVHTAMGVFGLVFDGLVIWALLYKPTRKIAFGLSIFFHLFNSYVFQIGIFPYLSLAFCVFFFPAEELRIWFHLARTEELAEGTAEIPKHSQWSLPLIGVYLVIQFLLPLRHFTIKEPVIWTEEGHRMSWRMMLRSRNGHISFRVKDKNTGEMALVKLEDYLTRKQIRKVATYPDFAWQFAQRLKREYEAKGLEVEIYAQGRVSINRNTPYPLIDPEVDLAQAKWDYFFHNEWILPYPEIEVENASE